jgi:hypothetical protein
MTGHWFIPKTYGYGATPANWKGWAVLGLFMAGLIGGSYLLLAWQPSSGTGPGALRNGVWAVANSMLTVGFIVLARAKTDGQWGWRWGK